MTATAASAAEAQTTMPRFNRVSRRTVLSGLGVCLALPWLESARVPNAKAATTADPRRFLAVYFPNGVAAGYWRPARVGAGSEWQLSPLLDPLAPVKSRLTVLSNIENYSCIQDTPYVEPSHSRLTGAFLTCVDGDSDPSIARAGISVDQVIAQRTPDVTSLPSLQVGLSTLDSSPDGRHGALSRSISWSSANEPLYKVVDPQAVFDRLTSGTLGGGSGSVALREAERRRALDKSVLDYVLESSHELERELSASDRVRFDQFTTSVRDLERRLNRLALPGLNCHAPPRPETTVAVGQTPNGYDRNAHAELMIDLIVMALECDLTRVVSFMLDDSRSDFDYSFVPRRTFDTTGSTPALGRVGPFHAAQHEGDSNDNYATINHWLVSKVAQLAERLANVQEGEHDLLHNSLLFFGSDMQGSNHDGNDLPALLLGAAGGRFKTDQHLSFEYERSYSELYLTVLNRYFDLDLAKFGVATSAIDALLA